MERSKAVCLDLGLSKMVSIDCNAMELSDLQEAIVDAQWMHIEVAGIASNRASLIS